MLAGVGRGVGSAPGGCCQGCVRLRERGRGQKGLVSDSLLLDCRKKEKKNTLTTLEAS